MRNPEEIDYNARQTLIWERTGEILNRPAEPGTLDLDSEQIRLFVESVCQRITGGTAPEDVSALHQDMVRFQRHRLYSIMAAQSEDALVCQLVFFLSNPTPTDSQVFRFWADNIPEFWTKHAGHAIRAWRDGLLEDSERVQEILAEKSLRPLHEVTQEITVSDMQNRISRAREHNTVEATKAAEIERVVPRFLQIMRQHGNPGSIQALYGPWGRTCRAWVVEKRLEEHFAFGKINYDRSYIILLENGKLDLYTEGFQRTRKKYPEDGGCVRLSSSPSKTDGLSLDLFYDELMHFIACHLAAHGLDWTES